MVIVKQSYKMMAEDWPTHRWALGYHIFPLPYEDIPGLPGPVAGWEKKVYLRKF